MKYNKDEYIKYVKDIKNTLKEGERPISFKIWKTMQPIADNIVNKANITINKAI